MASVTPLIVITGPTGSGKSDIALKLAEKYGGEIICADSRTAYRFMDIGTAKPSLDDQKKVRHWLLDVANPDDKFSVSDFQALAKNAIRNIRSRGKVPFLVGGTGLYIDAIVLDFSFAERADLKLRTELEKLTTEQLKELIIKQRLTMPENENNRRYLIRCIEKNNAYVSGNSVPDSDTFVFALRTEKGILEKRISQRIDEMFDSGILKESQQLFDKYGQTNESMTGNIYPIVKRLIDGEINVQQAKELCVIRDRRLAKRQITWLKRHDYVRWVELEDAFESIGDTIESYDSQRDA